MRNIPFYILSSLLLLFTACDYNEEHFPELDELVAPVDIRTISDSLVAEDYAAIAELAANKALAKEEGVTAELENLKSSQRFSVALPAKSYMPAYLADKWPTFDNLSTVKVTYNFQNEYPAHLTDLSSAEVYEVTENDYENVWGNSFYPFFTPVNSLENYAGNVLQAAFPEAVEGQVVALNYNYYGQEPAAEGLMDAVVDEDFSSLVEDERVELDAWVNYAEVGNELWEGRSYDGNSYPQVSAYGAGGETVAWLISPEIDLAHATNPTLSFDVNLGYFNAYLMQVLISEDYTSGDPTAATWKDVTHHFGIYSAPSGYTNFYVAGVYDMSSFQEKPFRVAFRYAGDANNDKTTTYQIDNFQIGNENTVIEKDIFSDDYSGGLDKWSNISVQGDAAWRTSDYNDVYRAEFSAYKTTGEQETWLVSPGIAVPNNGVSQLLIDMAIGHHNADCLSILFSEDFTGDVSSATWTDVTGAFVLPDASGGGYTAVEPIGAFLLNDYKDKNIFVAFKYVGNAGDSRTTTYQIYDVNVVNYERGEFIPANPYTTENFALFNFDGSTWQGNSEAIVLNGSVYDQMGISYFSSSNKTEDYLPNYLKMTFPYALEGDVQTVAFFYGSGTDLSAEDFEFSNGVWTKLDRMEVVTDQFVKTNGSWIWNPSVVINLGPVRNDPLIMSYFQAAADWVWENIDVPAGAIMWICVLLRLANRMQQLMVI
ncbi:MAG: DUF5017 domain-containing protein [Bacteroidales bacterium]|nr:DUF5017 domain-containing protein [Bacteroidales bacterium]